MARTIHQKNRAVPKREGVIIHSWWVFLFIALSCGVYAHAVQKKREVIGTLASQFRELVSEKEQLQRHKEDLMLQINSQSDPAWVELTLMKGLGLVPEGQVKVYFQSD